MQAPIHAKDDEGVMSRVIAIIGGLVILGLVFGGFFAFSGTWSPPATTSSASHSQPTS